MFLVRLAFGRLAGSDGTFSRARLDEAVVVFSRAMRRTPDRDSSLLEVGASSAGVLIRIACASKHYGFCNHVASLDCASRLEFWCRRAVALVGLSRLTVRGR